MLRLNAISCGAAGWVRSVEGADRLDRQAAAYGVRPTARGTYLRHDGCGQHRVAGGDCDCGRVRRAGWLANEGPTSARPAPPRAVPGCAAICVGSGRHAVARPRGPWHAPPPPRPAPPALLLSLTGPEATTGGSVEGRGAGWGGVIVWSGAPRVHAARFGRCTAAERRLHHQAATASQ